VEPAVCPEYGGRSPGFLPLIEKPSNLLPDEPLEPYPWDQKPARPYHKSTIIGLRCLLLQQSSGQVFSANVDRADDE
jgi:hypothetical protein